jgi:hypothetical protein
VLFDPDWNPASDKQAAGRIWREGQKRRCYIYRFMSTGSIEEKIIQRQLSKEGLQNIVDNVEQVNQFSTEELRRLFGCRSDTNSDTHDTLRCKRCKNVKAISNTQSKFVLTEQHVDACCEFIQDFDKYIQSQLESEAQCTIHSGPLECLQNDLRAGKYGTLPELSRKLRVVLLSIEEEYQQHESMEVRALTEKLQISREFMSRWSALVPRLTALPKPAVDEGKGSDQKSTENILKAAARKEEGSDGESEDEGFVEQEGCPDDTDFNRWSHHCSVATCDDEVLKTALGDDGTVRIYHRFNLWGLGFCV